MAPGRTMGPAAMRPRPLAEVFSSLHLRVVVGFCWCFFYLNARFMCVRIRNSFSPLLSSMLPCESLPRSLSPFSSTACRRMLCIQLRNSMSDACGGSLQLYRQRQDVAVVTKRSWPYQSCSKPQGVGCLHVSRITVTLRCLHSAPSPCGLDRLGCIQQTC